MKVPVLLQGLRLPPMRMLWAIGLGSLVLGSLGLWQSSLALSDAGARLAQARRQLKNTQTELEAAQALDARLRPAWVRFQALQTRGIVGVARPEEWLDRARQALSTQGLHPVARFSPLQPLEPAGPPDRLRLQGSTLNLETSLLHEAELPNLLGLLEAERSALVLVRACRIERLAAAQDSKPIAATLRANCTLDWLTITPPGAR